MHTGILNLLKVRKVQALLQELGLELGPKHFFNSQGELKVQRGLNILLKCVTKGRELP